MNTIAPAPNPKAQLYQALETAPGLTALGITSPEQILPRADIDPTTAPRPFLIVRFEGAGMTGDDLEHATWAIDVHDDANAGDVLIDAILAELKRIFRRARWSLPTASATKPRSSTWAGRSAPFADPDFGTRAATGRFTLTQS